MDIFINTYIDVSSGRQGNLARTAREPCAFRFQEACEMTVPRAVRPLVFAQVSCENCRGKDEPCPYSFTGRLASI